jgi:hypothetical protein
MGFNYLLTDSGEILGSGYRYAAPQVEQGACEGLQDDLIVSAYESHASPFPEVKPVTDCAGESDLSSTPYLADYHRTILHLADNCWFIRQLTLYMSKAAMSSH